MENNKEQKSENNQNQAKGRKWKVAVILGLSAGVIFGLTFLLFYYLQFINVGPATYAKVVLNPEYLEKWQGQLIGVGFFIIFSVIFSLIYSALFIKIKSFWTGIVYGFLLWVLVFVGLNWLFDLTKPVKELGFDTITATLCLYILFGVFLGYSLTTEFNNLDR